MRTKAAEAARRARTRLAAPPAAASTPVMGTRRVTRGVAVAAGVLLGVALGPTPEVGVEVAWAKAHDGEGTKKYAPGRGPSKKRKSKRRSRRDIRRAGRGAPDPKSPKRAATPSPAPSRSFRIPRKKKGTCFKNMAKVGGAFCIDRYEAYVAEVLPSGKLRRLSPYAPVGDKPNLRALVRKGRMPQGYISRNQAERACRNSGKRLCTDSEWVRACKGKKPTTWPYGDEHKARRCNDRGRSHFNELFGEGGEAAPQSAYTFENLNDPRLNRAKGTCAAAGKFRRCRNSYGLYDMVGNLHEWTATPSGTFRGGYYLDVHQHGDGCDYKTTAHAPRYHDYSTGFRCCADL